MALSSRSQSDSSTSHNLHSAKIPSSLATEEDLANFSTLLNCVASSDQKSHGFVRSLLKSLLSMFKEQGEPVNTEQGWLNDSKHLSEFDITFALLQVDTMLLTIVLGVKGFFDELSRMPKEIPTPWADEFIW